MRAQLGSFKEQLTNLDWSAIAEAGGNTTAGGSINLRLQLRNRVGRNLPSPAKTVAYTAGQKITITLATTIRNAGEDPWQAIISGETTGNAADAVQLATYDLKSLTDQLTENTLPATVELTEDIHLETTNLAVATSGDLPLPAIAREGMVRSVTDQAGKIFVFRAGTASWVDYIPPSFFTDITNAQQTGGSNQLLSSDVPLLIPPLVFDSQVVTVTTTPVRYWLVNEAPEGNGSDLTDFVNLRISVNGNTISDRGIIWTVIYSGLIKFQLIGYYRILTAALDTGPDGVGVTQTWNASSNLIRLPDPLSPGYAAVYDIWLEGDSSVLAQVGYTAGDTISIEFDYIGKVGIPQPGLAVFFGKNVISGDGEKLLALPNKITTGAGLVDGFLVENRQTLTGVFNSAPANTPNQSIIIRGATGGTIRTAVGPTLADDEQILAVFSTEAGFTNPGEFSDPLTLNTASGITVTVNHPVNLSLLATIRSDYDDSAIASNVKADWENIPFRIYLLQGATLWEKQTLDISASAATQDIQITNLVDFVDVTGAPPSNADLLFGTDFSLFKPSKPTTTGLVGGTLAPDVYQVAFRYEYPAPNNYITKIRHDNSSAIKRFNTTFEEQLSEEKRFKDQILTIASARELDPNLRTDWSVWLFSDMAYTPYILDPTLLSADDGRDFIRFTNGTGGFRPFRTLIRVRDRTGALQPSYSTLTFASGLNVTSDTVGSSNVVSLDQSAIEAVTPSGTNLVDSAGGLLTDSSGNLLIA